MKKKFRFVPHVCLLVVSMFVAQCGDGDNSRETPATPPPIQSGKIQTGKIHTGTLPKKAPKKAAPSPAAQREKALSDVYFGPLPYPTLESTLDLPIRKKGSVVLMVFDALNVKHLSAYGYKRDTTPSITALAKRGLVLTNHVSNSSWTRPSYTTIITGLPKSRHGVELEGGWRLKPEIKTLAERFRDAGYRTAGFTGNPLVRKAWGFDQGFDAYEDPATLDRKAFFPDRVLVDLATKWIGKDRERPFFLVLFLTAPHTPYRPPLRPRTFLSQVPDGKVIEHPFKEYKTPLEKADHDKTVAAYDDEIAYMDTQVGRLIKYLRETNRLEDTVIAMTADHGEVFGDHNCYTHTYHMWEAALRVPFILVSPGQKPVGVMNHSPFTHVDVAPTLLDAVGIDYDHKDLPGVSIQKTLARSNHNHQRVLFSQYNAHGIRRQAIRRDGLKLVHHHRVEERAEKSLNRLEDHVKQAHPRNLPTLAWDGERYEYFDLAKDPGENTNLFSDNKESAELLKLLAALKGRITEGGKSMELTDEMIKALRNAGYLQ